MKTYLVINLVFWSMAIVLNMAGDKMISEAILFWMSGIGAGLICLILFRKKDLETIMKEWV